jgi:hypothetical protein
MGESRHINIVLVGRLEGKYNLEDLKEAGWEDLDSSDTASSAGLS